MTKKDRPEEDRGGGVWKRQPTFDKVVEGFLEVDPKRVKRAERRAARKRRRKRKQKPINDDAEKT